MAEPQSSGTQRSSAKKPDLRIGVIGVMGKGRSHAGLFPKLHGATLAAIVDRNPDAATFARECGVPFFSNVQDLIRSGLADAVFCVVPHAVRREVTIPCLEAGLHVLSEKPLAATPADAAAIVAAARKNGRVLAVNYQYRQRPAVRKAKALLDAGAVGKWYYAVMHHSVNRTQAYYDARSWRGTWAGEGGGVVVNQAPHPVEILMYLLGSFPKRVVALNSTLRHKIQTEDISTAVLQYDNGAQAMVHADTIGLPISEWWSIHGDRGTLRIEDRRVSLDSIDPDLPKAIAGGDGSTKPAHVHCQHQVFNCDEHDAKHVGMVQDFVDAVREGRPPLVDGPWALQCVELHAAIIASAMSRRAVDFPPDYAKYDALLERLADARSP